MRDTGALIYFYSWRGRWESHVQDLRQHRVQRSLERPARANRHDWHTHCVPVAYLRQFQGRVGLPNDWGSLEGAEGPAVDKPFGKRRIFLFREHTFMSCACLSSQYLLSSLRDADDETDTMNEEAHVHSSIVLP